MWWCFAGFARKTPPHNHPTPGIPEDPSEIPIGPGVTVPKLVKDGLVNSIEGKTGE